MVKPILILCGDSYQDISLYAALRQQSRLEKGGSPSTVLYLGEENEITKQCGEQVVLSRLKLEALRTTLKNYAGSQLLLLFADKQILNLLFRLEELAFFKEVPFQIVGPSLARYRAFYQQVDQRQLLRELGYQVPASAMIESVREAIEFSETIQYPIMVWPVASKQGQGRRIAHNLDDLCEAVELGLEKSPSHQCLLEFSTNGYKEFDVLFVRDREDNHYLATIVESIDPVGIHSSDSYQFMPAVSLSDTEYQNLREAALRITRSLQLTGVVSIKFALDTQSYQFYILEVNPFASDSVLMASMGLGYSLFDQAVALQMGATLSHLSHPVIPEVKALFEPSLDYIFFKIPVFPEEKQQISLGTQIHSRGAIYGFGKGLEEAYEYALKAMEAKGHLVTELDQKTDDELIQMIARKKPYSLLYIEEALCRGFEWEELLELSQVSPSFMQRLTNRVRNHSSRKEPQKTAFLPVEPSAGLYASNGGAYYPSLVGKMECTKTSSAILLVDDLPLRDSRAFFLIEQLSQVYPEKTLLLLSNRPLLDRLANKIYYLPVNEDSVALIQEHDEVETVIYLSTISGS